MSINVDHAFNQKDDSAVFKLTITTVLNDCNLDKKRDFSDLLYYTISLITAVIKVRFPEILNFFHEDHKDRCRYLNTCDTFNRLFLNMLDLDKIHADYLKAYADQEGGVKNGNN